MDNLIQNAITYWQITAFFAFIAIVVLQHLWRNRIGNTLTAVQEYEALFARYNVSLDNLHYSVTQLLHVVDSMPKIRDVSSINFPTKEVKNIMACLKTLRKSARTFHWFDCRYRILISYSNRLFEYQVVHEKLLGAENRVSHALTLLNQKLNY